MRAKDERERERERERGGGGEGLVVGFDGWMPDNPPNIMRTLHT